VTTPVDLAEKLAAFTDLWSPKVVARMNDYEIKVVKLQGEFEWHTHPDTDELFLVISGRLTIQLRDGDVTLGPGQLYVVPRGVEHCPITDEETHALLIEPVGVVNTGEAGGPLTATYDDSLAAAPDRDFRHLPDPIPTDQLTTTQAASDARDPEFGRDPNHDWLVRGI
jgi:mannose-6-phosphate isomerase-like protein (cupin superfamily)